MAEVMTAPRGKNLKPPSSQSEQAHGPVFLPPLRPKPVLFAVTWVILLFWLAVLIWMRMKTITPPEAGPTPAPQLQPH
jgi:hypothetical protein